MTDLPSFDDLTVISEDQRNSFDSNGHLLVENLCSPEELSPFIDPLLRVGGEISWNKDIPLEDQRTYDRAFHQAINLWRLDPIVKAFVMAKRFAHVAAQLLGVKGVRLYHDQLLNKKANGGHTPWHQDAFYWPVAGHHAITMWMPLVNVTTEMGIVQFANGSHRRGDLKGGAISKTSEQKLSELVDAGDFSLSSHKMLNAGDATFHAGWTLHRAGSNSTQMDRPAMTVIYIADQCTVLELEREEQHLDLFMYLPGLKEGDLAISPMNPLLWSQE